MTAWATTLAVRLVAGLPPPAADPEEQRGIAEEVLSRREFQRAEPSLIERIQEWIDRQLGDLIGSVTGGGTGTVVGWVILAVAVAVIVWLLARNRKVLLADPAAEAEVRIDAGRTPDEWREHAATLEAEGRWKEALRCRYRGLLGDLVRRGVIVDVPGRTAGEYLDEVAAACPPATRPMGAATAAFELAWYADRPTGATEAEAFREAASATLRAVDERGGRGGADREADLLGAAP